VSYPLKFAVVAVLMTLVDICYAKYIIATAEKRALPAASWSGAIMLCGAFVTVNYVGDHSLVAAAMLGAFVGTYVTVKREVA
jgi:hypothetical protein